MQKEKQDIKVDFLNLYIHLCKSKIVSSILLQFIKDAVYEKLEKIDILDSVIKCKYCCYSNTISNFEIVSCDTIIRIRCSKCNSICE